MSYKARVLRIQTPQVARVEGEEGFYGQGKRGVEIEIPVWAGS
jgi:hypothetical protein